MYLNVIQRGQHSSGKHSKLEKFGFAQDLAATDSSGQQEKDYNIHHSKGDWRRDEIKVIALRERRCYEHSYERARSSKLDGVDFLELLVWP